MTEKKPEEAKPVMVPEELFVAIVQVLGRLPYADVGGLMNRLMEVSRHHEAKRSGDS